MNQPRDQLTTPRRRLPERSLPAVATGASTPLWVYGRRQAPVLVLVHGDGCPRCQAYLRELEDGQASITEWDGRLLVVTPDGPADGGDAADGVGQPLLLLSDPDGQLAAALSVRAPATVVADQWGEIHSIEEAGPEHRFPSPSALADWARYLAVQCPECQGEAF